MVSDQNLTIVVYDSLERLEQLRSEWDALLDQYPLSTTFSTYEWLTSWWRAFSRTKEDASSNNDRLLVLAFRDSSSTLVGLAPMSFTVRPSYAGSLRILRLMGDGSQDSENLDFPVRPGDEARLASSLLGWMRQNAAWDVCEFNTLPADSAVGTRLRDEFSKLGWTVITHEHPQTIVELAETWEEHLKKISSKERGKIGLRTRKLEKKYEMQIHRCAEEREVDPLLQALVELHGKHWQVRGLPGTLHSPARRQFYRELARLLLARGRLQFWVLKVNGKIVAAQFGFRHNATVFSLQEGFDPEFAADSVGYVLRSTVLKHVIGEGVRRYDFLGGTDDSKLRWGGELKNYVSLHAARPFSRGSLYLTLNETGKKSKIWLRRHLSPGIWKTLKSVIPKSR